jgi:flagellar motor switch protein FliM
MNNDLLSQDEVDALLRGVQSGEIDTDTAKEKILSGVRNYDFTSQERIIRGRMPGLEITNERFTRFFRNSVSAFIKKFVDVGIQNTEITKFGDFMKTIPFPSSISIFKMEPLKGYALFVIEAPLVFAFIEFFFGGKSARYVKSEGKPFTAIEQRVIKRVVDLAFVDMANAWSGLTPIQPEHVGFEMNPQFVTIVTPSEIVVKIEVSVEIEEFSGKLFFCIPYSMVEPIKEKLYSGIQSERFSMDQRWVERLKEMLVESRVNVTAEIGKVHLTLSEILDLKEGNVISLGKAIKDELAISVEGVKKFSGIPGYSRGNQAIKVTKISERSV